MDFIAFLDCWLSSVRNGVDSGVDLALNGNFLQVFSSVAFDLVNNTVNFRDDRATLRVAGFEQFLHTRQTLSDVFCAGNTTGVESTQGQLGTWFTD